jgi:quercetin dioxygenase-like cupin family protein
MRSLVCPLEIPLDSTREAGWRPYPIFGISTANVGDLGCHASALSEKHCPHPPHTHDEEEILLVLDGEVNIILPDARPSQKNQRRRLQAGQFVYYPLNFRHTLETVSRRPANYLMFKWRNGAPGGGEQLGFGQFELSAMPGPVGESEGFQAHFLFEGPTAYLARLHCHASVLAPGAGYEPHADAHDVAIVVLAGQLETLGQRVHPYSVIFYPAGELHGMRNPGAATAKYVVFEFHGRKTAPPSADPPAPPPASAPPPPPSLWTKITDLQRWKRRLKGIFRC